MLRLFRSNLLLGNILILFYLVLLRSVVFVHPTAAWKGGGEGILSRWIFSAAPTSSLEAQVAAVLLIFVQAILINQLMSQYRVTNDVSAFPGLFYALMANLLPDYLTLSPILLGNTFLLLAIYYLYNTYRNQNCPDIIFDIGLWIGVASLFQFSFIIFSLWGIMGLAIMRGIRPKEVLMLLIGVFVPYLLIGVYLYWYNQLPMLFDQHILSNFKWLDIRIVAEPMSYLKLGIVGLLVIMVILSGSSFYSRRDVGTQKCITILYWTLFFAGLTLLTQANVQIEHLLIFALPLGMLLSLAFLQFNESAAETFHLLLLMGILILHYQYLLVR